jgi:hypothetical protein
MDLHVMALTSDACGVDPGIILSIQERYIPLKKSISTFPLGEHRSIRCTQDVMLGRRIPRKTETHRATGNSPALCPKDLQIVV